ncbi:MAG: flavodoxin family protein [Proteobacteria bacterium]|nr:flavodoxin family protein [Pseudomonadota bacterium]
MKIVAINGSARGAKGLTGFLVNNILESAQKSGAETETFVLHELDIRPCRACHVCSKTGTCAIKDDFPPIRDRIVEADGFIFASPNYVSNVSAQMKAFLDRNFTTYHCQTFRGKYGIVAVGSGGPAYESVTEYLGRIIGIMGAWFVGDVGVSQPELEDEECKKDVIESSAALGAQLVSAIAERETYQDQQEKIDEHLEIMKFIVAAQKEAWAYEYEYLKTHYGLED